ncbi:MAG: tRNA epoxyqueuosine(34) reductase QueG, partial [Planctomycetales bacterium]|nr:tRNA epoxyqueuosine(34) reductase QueG [Planctomycetales bacterium]
GRIARYAQGARDYHDVIHDRLKQLTRFVEQADPAVQARGVVDTAPLLEREFAQLAGLGWIGKNTLLLNRELGSYFFLAALLLNIELPYDQPLATDHCGSCRACLDACPTDAFPQPYVLDARRCISYLTIELRQAIPLSLREGIGDWLFGCDICQEVCPWNGRAPETTEPAFQPLHELAVVELCALFELDDAAFRQRFRATPLWRSKRRGILRNAAIVLGNRPTSSAIPALNKGLGDDEPLVRGACAWALGQFAERCATEALRARLECEPDADVRDEISSALGSR